MDVNQYLAQTILEGWRNHQSLLVAALAPLTADQLAFKPANSRLRSIESIATHMIGARARWFSPPLTVEDNQLSSLRRWDRRGEKTRTAAEIVHGLQYTGDTIHAAIARWTPEEWQETYPGEEHEPKVVTRPWIIWHLIEHDLHHGGEISLILGMHKLTAPDL